MTETLFEVGRTEVAPNASPDARRTRRQKAMIAQGIHPFGGKIHEEAARTCGNCVFVLRLQGSKAYYKCAKNSLSHSAASDIRLKWPACVLHSFEAEARTCATCAGEGKVELSESDRAYQHQCPWNWSGRGANRRYVGPTMKRCGTCLGVGKTGRLT